MNLKFGIIFTFFIPSLLFANTFEVRNLKNDAFIDSNFPFFSSKEYPESALKINAFLQYSNFERVLNESDFASATLSPFKGDASERDSYFYGFDAVEKQNYIVVTIDGEGCGAYCEGYTQQYVFDIYTGQPITLVDFFSAAALTSLEQKIKEINKKRIEPFIKEKPKDSWGEGVKLQYSMYKYCYESRFVEDTYHIFNKLDQERKFKIENGNIVITFGRCSNHQSRGVDEIGQFINKFSFKELEAYLTDDAKLYLSDQPHKLPKIKTSYKVYHGHIANKYPITLFKDQYGSWVYWYDKYKTPISLTESKTSSNKKAKGLVLQKGWSYANKYTSEFRIQENDGVFKGVFVRLKDGSEMSVIFK